MRWNRALAHVNEVEAKIAAHDAAAPPRPNRRARTRRFARQSQGRLGGADDGCAPQEAHRPHRHPGGGGRYRCRRCGDCAADPLGRRRPHRATPAAAAARSAQQHLARRHHRRPPIGPHRQRRSDRRHPQPESVDHRPWQSLDPRAGDGVEIASQDSRLPVSAGWNRAVAQPEQRGQASQRRAEDAQAGGRSGEIDASHPLPDGPWIFSRAALGSRRHSVSFNAHARTQATPRDRIPISKASSLQWHRQMGVAMQDCSGAASSR